MLLFLAVFDYFSGVLGFSVLLLLSLFFRFGFLLNALGNSGGLIQTLLFALAFALALPCVARTFSFVKSCLSRLFLI
ncbi:hypothetical protein EDC01DRAFT_712893 [Geopyxis carbonaria]|nr:hypothetical protein EDC01DRAFT_712893 [Geopyxis carbonaria]